MSVGLDDRRRGGTHLIISTDFTASGRTRSGCGQRRGSRLGRSLVAAAALSLPMQACTDENVTQVRVSSVTVAPEMVTVVVGDQVTLTATITDHVGEVVTGASPSWSSEAPSVATVDSAGVARGLSEGAAVIRATFGGASATATVRVVPGPGIDASLAAVALRSGAGGPPPQPVIVHVSNSGTGALTGLAASVEYPSGAPQWLQATLAGTTAPTTLTLTARTSGLAPGVLSATVSITSVLPNVPSVGISVTLTLAGFSLAETGGATVASEAGSADTLMVVLDTRPSEAVVFSVSGDPTEVAASPSTLSFEPDEWDVPRAITLVGIDDFIDDGDQVTNLTISVVPVASDDAYAGVPPKTIRVTTIDNDAPAGLTVTESGGDTRVSEGKTTDTFDVALTTQPATDVVLTITSADRGEVLVSPSTLIFGRSNWNQPHTVTVRGVDDFADDGDQVTGVTIAVVAVVSDDAFDAVPPSIVAVTNTDDDDPAGLSIEETGDTRVGEGGTTDIFTVALTSQPATDVVLTVTSGDTGEVIVTPSTLTFTSANWDVPQTVIVRGFDDLFDDGDQVTLVTVAVLAVVSDDSYDGLTPRAVSVTTTDNDG